MTLLNLTRRRFLQGSALAAGAGLTLAGTGRRAWAAGYPERNVTIVIPTAEGGGADRDIRTLTQVWRKHLNTNFEFEYYPGAGGQVGYELYVSKKQPDAYSLLFSNLGPEVIMQVLQKPKAKLGEDFVYFYKTSSEVMALWVGKNSKFQKAEDLVAEAKKRPVTISVSRLPHPASIGCLALAEATGANFRLVPFGGGNPSAMAAITGETDACALPIANPVQLGEEARILLTFGKNPSPAEADNAPAVNDVFGTKLPPLTSARGFAIHTKAIADHPDRFEALKASLDKLRNDPDYPKAVEAAGLPRAFIDFGDQADAMAEAEATQELARKYEKLLTGKG